MSLWRISGWMVMIKRRREKVSIIIPTYQEGRYIGNLLSHLTNIDHPAEIIIVDGGSTDKTIEVAKRFTDNIYQIKERGISKAKNYGAKNANGDILIFLDADVELPPDFINRVLDAFKDRRVVGATCNIMPSRPRPSERAFFLFYNLLLRFCSLFKPHSRGEFIAIRREVFMKIGGFNESLSCLEDHDLAMRASKIGKFIFINNLTIYETLRRIRKLGLLNVVRTWMINYIFFIIRGKPLAEIWKAVR